MNLRIYSVLCLVCSTCFLLGGCGPDQSTVWSATVPSPNGQLLAYAQAVTGGGFGGDYAYTEVSILHSNNRKGVTALVLNINCSYPKRTASIKMQWASPDHLNITHTHCTDTDVRVAEVMGVTITVREQNQ